MLKKMRKTLLTLALIASMCISSVMPIYAREHTAEAAINSSRSSGRIEKQVHFSSATSSITVTVPSSKTVKFTLWVSDAPSVSVNCSYVYNGSSNFLGTFKANGADHVKTLSYSSATSRTYTFNFRKIAGEAADENLTVSCYLRVDYS